MATSRLPRADLLAEPAQLQAGPVEGTLECGMLRWLIIGGREFVRGVYMAVRDPDWGTVPPQFTRYEIQRQGAGFRVDLAARHVAPGIDFRWVGTIEGTDTYWRYSIEGEPVVPFQTARIGLCLLHPSSAAGRSVRVDTPWGRLNGKFPEQIAPMSLFGGFDRLSQSIGDGEITISFEGDLFEMEDQRNWTDASFKTYSTPLQHHCPRLVEPGQVVKQSITITVHNVSGRATRASRTVASLSLGKGGKMPEVGIMASPGNPGDLAARTDLLKRVRPAHLRVAIDGDGPNVLAALSDAAAESKALGAPLEIELIVPADRSEISRLVDHFARADAEIVRILAFDRDTFVTTRRVATALRDAMNAAGLHVPLGGGSRADFYELNLTTLPHLPNLPVDLLQLISFRITPQVHAVDNATVMENLEGARAAIRSARTIARDIPLAIGPATLLPMFNPSAAAGGSQPAPTRDRRQSTPFAAAWTVGLLQVAVEEGLAALTCHQGAGAAGIISTEGSRAFAFPVCEVLAAVAGRVGQDARGIGGPRRLAGLAIGSDHDSRWIVANLSESPLEARLPKAPAGLATSLAGAAEVVGRPGHQAVALGPYGVLMLGAE